MTPPAVTGVPAGVVFSESFTASGGTAPHGMVLASGALPAGLSLAGDGTLSGTPTEVGSFPITVEATDAFACTGISPTYTLAIGCPTITVTPPATTTATAGTAYSDAFAASGGVGTTTFAVTSGALPSGLTLAADGTLSGTPTGTGGFTFTVTATDANGCTGTGSSFDLTVAAGAPASLVVSGGSSQQTPVETSFPVPLQVTVTDGEGNPVPGALVTFTAVSGVTGASAALSDGGTATTDSLGQASVVATANGVSGSHTVEATVGPLLPAVFDLANVSVVLVPTLGSSGLGLLMLLLAGSALLLIRRIG